MATYKPLQSVVLTANASEVVFSGIDQSYTDLIVVVSGASTTAGSSTNGLRWQINGDTGSNYSETQLYGNGSSVTSTGATNATDIGAGLLMQTSAGYFATNIIHFMNYSNTTTYKSMLTRNGGASVSVAANASLWRSTAAITSIKFYRLTDQLKSGSTFDLYGIKSGAPQALGGDVVVTDGSYWYHAFKSTGAFTPLKTLSADVLIVAGGGGGARNGGGGGAGGVVGYSSTTLPSKQYSITVGAGGAGGTVALGDHGRNGTNSTFTDLTTAVGGGAGASYGYSTSFSGGSGGGAPRAQVVTGGAGTTNQGYKGGNCDGGGGSGGGGGAGAAGGNNSGSVAGNGGVGATYTTTIAGTAGPYSFINAMGSATGTGQLSGGNYYYAGGGGGGAANPQVAGTPGSGSLGGGGNGGSQSGGGSAGTDFTGGGGGGSGYDAYNGGSGVVIVRYPV